MLRVASGFVPAALRGAAAADAFPVPAAPHAGRRAALGAFASLAAAAGARRTAAADPQARAREAMLLTIENHARSATGALGRPSIDPRVLEALRRVPRHAFVPTEVAANAYEDRPLPIGHGQTISQPFIVALMTDMLRTAPGQVVLEVGTGSGYQAAVLSALVGAVHSIEIITVLADTAERRLRALGHANVAVHRGDGYHGVPQAAPFDGIMVTAASAGGIPPPLLDQLRPGGRMVIPVGGGFALQHLVLVEKATDGKMRTRQTLPVAFVPLVRGAGGG
jgi:protein-L-isoaspartate(D-aspartate) O-methyltransferase